MAAATEGYNVFGLLVLAFVKRSTPFRPVESLPKMRSKSSGASDQIEMVCGVRVSEHIHVPRRNGLAKAIV